MAGRGRTPGNGSGLAVGGRSADDAGGDVVSGDCGDGSSVASMLRMLEAAIGGLTSVDVEELPEGELRGLVEGLRRPRARLDAVVARVAGALEVRAAVRAGPEGVSAATREARAFLGDRLGLSPAEARRAGETGRRLVEAPATQGAFVRGELLAGHAAVITETLAEVPLERVGVVEAELLALAAGGVSPRVLRVEAKRILAREDAGRVERLERIQHGRRRFSHWREADGALGFSGRLYGALAEQAQTAFQAFSRPDTPGERRTPQQRGADGFDALVGVALGAAKAPTRHGVRPHVLVLVDAATLAGGAGLAELGSGEPTTVESLRPLLRDCTFSRVILGPGSVPLEVSETVRTVPAGLWRALLARDRGCRWPGCDAPPAWCDVAHAHVPFRDGGKLSPANATLLCRRHHRRFDAGAYTITIEGAAVHITPTAGGELPGEVPPAAGEVPGGGAQTDRAGPGGRQQTLACAPRVASWTLVPVAASCAAVGPKAASCTAVGPKAASCTAVGLAGRGVRGLRGRARRTGPATTGTLASGRGGADRHSSWPGPSSHQHPISGADRRSVGGRQRGPPTQRARGEANERAEVGQSCQPSGASDACDLGDDPTGECTERRRQ